MNTYQTQVTKGIADSPISDYWKAYFRENFRGELNDALLEAFRSSGLAKADIARKLERRPEQVTRWLSAPCNLEADTISDLALALGLVPRVRFEKAGETPSNTRTHAFLHSREALVTSGESKMRSFILNSNSPLLSASTSNPKSVVGPASNELQVLEFEHA